MTLETREILFENVTIVGIGHIGSSVARAIRWKWLAHRITALETSPEHRKKALELAVCEAATDDPETAVKDADLVVICTPLGTYADIAKAIGPHLKPGTIVSDVGSCKESVFGDVMPHLPDGVHFIPGHPVAGTEKSGPEAGFRELFDGRWAILTPPENADPAAVERMTKLWQGMGSNVEIMTPKHHDMVLAITSHLPHLIAYTIVGTATDLADDLKGEVVKYSAGGFRDFTRIAGSNPVMWRDVFLKNSDAVLEVLGRFTEDLTALQRAIRRGQGEALHDTFERTRDIRQGVIDAKQA
jgi:cyclohexadieny/prephenate dehydrogenase